MFYEWHLFCQRNSKILKALLSGFFYPSRLPWHIITAQRAVYIISPSGCISSRASVYSPAAWWYTKLRFDDIPQQVADDIHAFGVIGRAYFLVLNKIDELDGTNERLLKYCKENIEKHPKVWYNEIRKAVGISASVRDKNWKEPASNYRSKLRILDL